MVSRALSIALSVVKKPFTRAPATSRPDPEEDVVDLEGAQDTQGQVPPGIQLLNQGTHGMPEINATPRNKTLAGNIVTNRSAASRSSLQNLQDIGLKIVKFWVLPTSMVMAPTAITTSVNLYQVFQTNQSVAGSTKTSMLKPFFVSVIINVALGAILFPLSTIKRNFWGKASFLKVTIILTSASAIAEIVLMSALGWQFLSLV